MKPYIYSSGIDLWELIEGSNDESLSTVTLLEHSLPEIKAPWESLEEQLLKLWPIRLKWRTLEFGTFYSKSADYILRKRLESQMTPNDLLRKNTKTGIYSYIKSIENTLPIDINEYTYPRCTVLLLMKEKTIELNALWETLSHADKSLTSPHIYNLIKTYKNIIVCRFLESDTEAAIQMICSKENADIIAREVKRQNRTEIPMSSAHLYINRELDIHTP